MHTDDAEDTLNKMFADAGVGYHNPESTVVWRVFKDFARLPVECAEDGILFQCGVYAFSGPEQFEFDFTRQFTIEEDGEYHHMEQLNCTLLAPPTEQLKTCETNLWSFDFASLDAYFKRVESLEPFQRGLRTRYDKLRVRQNSV